MISYSRFMKIDFEIEPENHICRITVQNKDVAQAEDINNIVGLINAISADFFLDADIEPEDIEDILEQSVASDTQEKYFVLEISEDGLEVEFH
jgi:hypothetical protein